MNIQAKELAWSLAGHDKGKLYVVIAQEEDGVWLADGKIRTLERPKRKKRKHVQMIRHLPAGLKAQMEKIGTDADLRRILTYYNKQTIDQQEE